MTSRKVRPLLLTKRQNIVRARSLCPPSQPGRELEGGRLRSTNATTFNRLWNRPDPDPIGMPGAKRNRAQVRKIPLSSGQDLGPTFGDIWNLSCPPSQRKGDVCSPYNSFSGVLRRRLRLWCCGWFRRGVRAVSRLCRASVFP